MKFSSWKRSSTVVKNRPSNIKTQIVALEDKSDLNVSEKATLRLFIQEAKTKYDNFYKKLDDINNEDPEPVVFDEEAILEIECKISDLYVSIQGLIVSKWPAIAKELDIAKSY